MRPIRRLRPEPKPPRDLPAPVCEAHLRREPCDRCSREDRIERFVIFGALVLVAITMVVFAFVMIGRSW